MTNGAPARKYLVYISKGLHQVGPRQVRAGPFTGQNTLKIQRRKWQR